MKKKITEKLFAKLHKRMSDQGELLFLHELRDGGLIVVCQNGFYFLRYGKWIVDAATMGLTNRIDLFDHSKKKTIKRTFNANTGRELKARFR